MIDLNQIARLRDRFVGRYNRDPQFLVVTPEQRFELLNANFEAMRYASLDEFGPKIMGMVMEVGPRLGVGYREVHRHGIEEYMVWPD